MTFPPGGALEHQLVVDAASIASRVWAQQPSEGSLIAALAAAVWAYDNPPTGAGKAARRISEQVWERDPPTADGKAAQELAEQVWSREASQRTSAARRAAADEVWDRVPVSTDAMLARIALALWRYDPPTGASQALKRLAAEAAKQTWETDPPTGASQALKRLAAEAAKQTWETDPPTGASQALKRLAAEVWAQDPPTGDEQALKRLAAEVWAQDPPTGDEQALKRLAAEVWAQDPPTGDEQALKRIAAAVPVQYYATRLPRIYERTIAGQVTWAHEMYLVSFAARGDGSGRMTIGGNVLRATSGPSNQEVATPLVPPVLVPAGTQVTFAGASVRWPITLQFLLAGDLGRF
ncbi:MAG: hypothetical protein OXH14_03225 [Alphaproteobacteria bacterium]|nr:hypothetical protein [Alphaproteobacteria bacterium]